MLSYFKYSHLDKDKEPYVKSGRVDASTQFPDIVNNEAQTDPITMEDKGTTQSTMKRKRIC